MDGAMQTIRSLLSQGKSSREIIDLGFAPRTVYKVQQDFRRRNPAAAEISPGSGAALQQDFEYLKTKVESLESKGKVPDETFEGTQERPADPCPICGEDVGWSKLPARRSLLAMFLEHGYYRRCPSCRRERQVAV